MDSDNPMERYESGSVARRARSLETDSERKSGCSVGVMADFSYKS